jgi:hypothetical protein
MRKTACSLAALLMVSGLLAGCSSKPEITDMFRQQLTRFLEEGTTTTAMTEQGISYLQFQQRIPAMNGAYDLAVSTWPEGFSADARSSFERALDGWDLALDLWSLDIGDKDNPLEPNINGYQRYVDYAGDMLVYDTHPSNFIVEDYRGKTFLPFDENISILLAIASDAFDDGKDLALEALD